MIRVVDRKLPKSAVSFEHPAKGMNVCADCVHYIVTYEKCKIVAGDVQPGDWCRKFKKGGPSS